MEMTNLQSDKRFSLEFYQDLYTRYGVEDEDYHMTVVGKSWLYYYIELYHASGVEQIIYKKDNNTWEFIT